MDFKKVEELVKKYWDCETSLEEEQELREYFRTQNVPEQLRETATLFRYFEEQKSKSLDVHFDQGVVSQIKNAKPAGRSVMMSVVYNSMRIAAGIAVLVFAVYFIRQEIRNDDTMVATEDTFDDPQAAFEETKKALMMISKGFGRAEQQAKRINMFNEAQEKIQSTNTETEL